MNHWTLYVDESGSFADLLRPVLLAGVLWRHSDGENLDAVKQQHISAVPEADWPWHSLGLVMARYPRDPAAEGIANRVFSHLRASAKSLWETKQIELVLAVESELGDVVPPICCRWRKLFRVLVERSAQILALQPGKHHLRVSAQWLPFMQQRPRNVDDFRDRKFMGNFQKLAGQALDGMYRRVENGNGGWVSIDKVVGVVSFSETNTSIPVGHVLADFCAFNAGTALRSLRAGDDAELERLVEANTGVPLWSQSHVIKRSHIAASGRHYCDQAWLTNAVRDAAEPTDEAVAGASWVAERSRQWKGALAGHTLSDTISNTMRK